MKETRAVLVFHTIEKNGKFQLWWTGSMVWGTRYTFRRIEYACKNNKFAECFQLGWYLQVELDILTEEAALDKMDLLGSYDADDLTPFEKRNRKICEKHKAGSFLEELADLFNLSVETIRKIIYRK